MMETATPYAASTGTTRNTIQGDKKVEGPTRDVAREQTDAEKLLELAHFLNHTRPPTTREVNFDSAKHCSFKSESREKHSRWSMRSLRRRTRGKPPRQSSQLRQSSILRTTAAGHQYRAISIPCKSPGESRPPFPSRLPTLQQQHDAPGLGFRRRSSSAGRQDTTSPRSLRRQPSKREPANLAAFFSQPSLQCDDCPSQLTIRVSTAKVGVRSLARIFDEWLQDHSSRKGSTFQSQRGMGPSQLETGSLAMRIPLSRTVRTVRGKLDHGDFTTRTRTTVPMTAPPTATVRLSSSPSLRGDFPHHAASSPMLAPAVEVQEQSLPDLAPQTQSARLTTMSQRSSESAFRVAPSTSPKAKAVRQSHVRSPEQPREPASTGTKRALGVPQRPYQPGSPSFTEMLATMTFPLPPFAVADAIDPAVLGCFAQLEQRCRPQEKRTPQLPFLTRQALAPETPSKTTATEPQPQRSCADGNSCSSHETIKGATPFRDARGTTVHFLPYIGGANGTSEWFRADDTMPNVDRYYDRSEHRSAVGRIHRSPVISCTKWDPDIANCVFAIDSQVRHTTPCSTKSSSGQGFVNLAWAHITLSLKRRAALSLQPYISSITRSQDVRAALLQHQACLRFATNSFPVFLVSCCPALSAIQVTCGLSPGWPRTGSSAPPPTVTNLAIGKPRPVPRDGRG